jgi:Ubiquitin-2 like Rad60 SUMO-like
MQLVFDTYAQRKGIPATSIRFLLDNEEIANYQTPQDLELKDHDIVYCFDSPPVVDSTPFQIFVKNLVSYTTTSIGQCGLDLDLS